MFVVYVRNASAKSPIMLKEMANMPYYKSNVA